MKKVYDLIVSIGSKCKCAYNLRRNGLQLEAFPFDWIYVPKIATIEQLFVTDFASFLREENLRIRNKQPKFDEVDDLATGIYSAHDFDANKTIHESYSAVKAKYDRRIKKLKIKLEEADRILMVFTTEDESQSDEEVLEQFALLQKCFANKKMDFLYVSILPRPESFERTQLSSNVTKVAFYRDEQYEWHGEAKMFDLAFENIRLSWKTMFKWYSSRIYLNGLKNKLILGFLKCVSGFILIKKYRKIFRAKYLPKETKF